MKQRLLHLIIVIAIAIVATASEASAQTKAYLGYCEGEIANSSSGRVTGLSGNESYIDLAVRLPRQLLQGYKGCNISAIHFGLPAAEAYPDFVTGWVRSSKSGANLIEGTITKMAPGWCDVPTTKPYTITGDEEELWVGVSYRQIVKLSIISFAGAQSPDGAWVGKNGTWTDYSAKGWGSLAVEAIVEGALPTHNLTFLDVQSRQKFVEIGKGLPVSGTIRNMAASVADHPVIRYSINDGAVEGTYTVPATLDYHESCDFAFDIPTDAFDDETTANVELTLCWADGTPDDAPDDNVAHFSLELVRELYYRTMVVEEATGAWCGWCVYGIVGLREMKQKHPDTFIGIAVHDGDSYVVSAYDSWMGQHISGYPSCLVNRKKGEETPMPTELQRLYDLMDPIAEAGVKVSATWDGSKVRMTSETRFFADHAAADYRIVFVVTENRLPIVQTNYYSGNARGEMGGFESMDSPCKIDVDDVARGIYPSVTGTKGSIPASVSKGSTYGYAITTDLPKYRDAQNLEVIAILIDGKTGEIIQGAKTDKIYGLNAEAPEDLDGIVAPQLSSAASAEQGEGATYLLDGRRVSRPAKGSICIQGGRKVIR